MKITSINDYFQWRCSGARFPLNLCLVFFGYCITNSIVRRDVFLIAGLLAALSALSTRSPRKTNATRLFAGGGLLTRSFTASSYVYNAHILSERTLPSSQLIGIGCSVHVHSSPVCVHSREGYYHELPLSKSTTNVQVY